MTSEEKEQDQEEYSNGSIWIKFVMPSIRLVSVIPKKTIGTFGKVAEATRKRLFNLDGDWQISLDKVDYMPKLNGVVTIPAKVDGKPLEFDGATVPVPWLVSLLTVGLLRPLGVMLTASIVHDFAYWYGFLWVESKGGGPKQKVEVERHHVDHLFRDIIGTVNGVKWVGWAGWFFVRVGWIIGVAYNGKRWGGKPPYMVIAIVLAVLTAAVVYLFEGSEFQSGNLLNILGWGVCIYLVFYAATLIALKLNRA